jgi:hypothetical protein
MARVSRPLAHRWMRWRNLDQSDPSSVSERPLDVYAKQGRASLQLANVFEELGASAAEPGSVRLQARQYGHVTLLDDTLTESLYVATASFIASLAVALSDGVGWN